MSNIFDDERMRKNLFARAPQDSEWPIIRAFVKKNKSAAHWKGDKWKELLIHWAALGNLAGTVDLVAQGASINELDCTGRSPLAWALEKAYFLATDPPKEMNSSQIGGELKRVEATALHLIGSGSALTLHVGTIAEGYGLYELVAKSGLFYLSAAFAQQGYKLTDKDYISLIEGAWLNDDKMCSALSEFKVVDPVDISGKPFSLIATELFIEGRISGPRLRAAAEALGGIDLECRDGTGLAEICQSHPDGASWQAKIEAICEGQEESNFRRTAKA